MLRVYIFSIFCLLIFSINSFAAKQTKAIFQIGSLGKAWEKVESPLPGLEAVYVNNTEKKSANITILKDATANLYSNIDDYVRDAVKIVKEQKVQDVVLVKSANNKTTGKYYLIYSKKGEEELIQAVFFRLGYGFYVLTATAKTSQFNSVLKDLEKAISGARFL